MRKHLSVFGLYARSSIFKVIGIMILMCGVQSFFFIKEMNEALETYELVGNSFARLERIFDRGAINVYFAIAFALITVVLCLQGCRSGSQTNYTLQRLSVSERATFFHQAAYNTLVYVILTAVQSVIVYGLSLYYLKKAPAEVISGQTVFLAFYKSEFLHSLLPFADIPLWIRNGILALSLGFTAAEFPYKNRRNKFSVSVIVVGTFTIVFFERGIGDLSNVVITGIVALIVLGEMLYTVFGKDDAEEAKSDE